MQSDKITVDSTLSRWGGPGAGWRSRDGVRRCSALIRAASELASNRLQESHRVSERREEMIPPPLEGTIRVA